MIVKTQLDVNTVQGDHLVLNFSVYDEDGNELSLTGKTIKWAARNTLTKKKVLEKETGDGIAILDAPDDYQFNVEVTSEETALLVGAHEHEAVIIDGAEKISIKNGNNSFGKLTFREKIV